MFCGERTAFALVACCKNHGTYAKLVDFILGYGRTMHSKHDGLGDDVF